MSMIPIVKDGFALQKNDGTPVCMHELHSDFRGDRMKVMGGTVPAHAGSTGRVRIMCPKEGWEQDVFPSVLGMAWVVVCAQCDGSAKSGIDCVGGGRICSKCYRSNKRHTA